MRKKLGRRYKPTPLDDDWTTHAHSDESGESNSASAHSDEDTDDYPDNDEEASEEEESNEKLQEGTNQERRVTHQHEDEDESDNEDPEDEEPDNGLSRLKAREGGKYVPPALRKREATDKQEALLRTLKGYINKISDNNLTVHVELIEALYASYSSYGNGT